MEQVFCQSCAMPLDDDTLWGSTSDGSKTSEYCQYCYEKGNFTFQGSMDEMIEICVPHMVKAHDSMTEIEARTAMQGFFPQLKRWKQ